MGPKFQAIKLTFKSEIFAARGDQNSFKPPHLLSPHGFHVSQRILTEKEFDSLVISKDFDSLPQAKSLHFS